MWTEDVGEWKGWQNIENVKREGDSRSGPLSDGFTLWRWSHMSPELAWDSLHTLVGLELVIVFSPPLCPKYWDYDHVSLPGLHCLYM